jgi:hypothetical protein
MTINASLGYAVYYIHVLHFQFNLLSLDKCAHNNQYFESIDPLYRLLKQQQASLNLILINIFAIYPPLPRSYITTALSVHELI